MVDKYQVIQWFRDRIGALTYSMYGSRNGNDGTADCSGSMTQAVFEAGGSQPAYLYSTETLHDYLTANGYQLIVENDQNGFNAQVGDIVIWGQRGASAGAGGHVVVMTNEDDCISTCYYTGGEYGTAVQELNYNYFVSLDGYPYYYVYRLTDDGPQQPTIDNPEELTTIQKFQQAGNAVTFNKTQFEINYIDWQYGMWQFISTELSAGGADWLLNGIPLALVTLTDNSNQSDAQVGNHCIFDAAEYDIIAYDVPTNSICVDARGLGNFWVNADVAWNA